MKKLMLMFSVASLALFVACKKKDDGGPATNNPYGLAGQPCNYQVPQPGYVCQNGILVVSPYGGTGDLLNNVQFQNSYFQGSVFLSSNGGLGGVANPWGSTFGNGTTFGSGTGTTFGGGFGGTWGGATNAYDPSGSRAIVYYAGQVTVTGTLNVNNQTLCGAPIGAYSIQGTGNSMYGSFSNLQLTASGGATIQLNIYSAQVYNRSGTGVTRESSDNRLGIVSAQLVVNGQPCGSITAW